MIPPSSANNTTNTISPINSNGIANTSPSRLSSSINDTTTTSTSHTPTPSSELYGSPTSSARSDGLKVQYDEIVKDPSNMLNAINLNLIANENSLSEGTNTIASTSSTTSINNSSITNNNNNSSNSNTLRLSRIHRFKKILHSSNVDLNELKPLAWSGVPNELRPITWQLLLGYLPTNAERRVNTLSRKRKEYLDGVEQAFSTGLDQVMWHQISIDVPRTNPHIELYSFNTTQRALERILYLWAIRHPASGYVQGINDLVTPIFQTFLSAYIDVDPEKYDPVNLPKHVLDAIEADSFWCLTKLLDGIQDNYIHAQPGIQRQVAELKELTQRIDGTLVKHLTSEGVEFMQFSFRWMNCLLMRELSVKNIVRMWDTYISEGATGFSEFHVYVCAAFLVKWSFQIMEMDFQEIMMFLQALPTKDWGEDDIGILLSEAYTLQTLYKNAAAHLR